MCNTTRLRLKRCYIVGWGAIALDGFPGLWRMAFDVRKPNKNHDNVGLRVAQPNLHFLNRTVLN
jgi:hypothetical protein